MKKLTAVIAMVVAVGFGATLAAEAQECPLLLKELRERSANWPNPIRADLRKGIAEAQKLYDEGKHAECVKRGEEVAKAAGITLQVKP